MAQKYIQKHSQDSKKKMPQYKVVFPQTSVKEYPEDFRVDNDLLFCKFCNIPIECKRKSTVDDHIDSKSHKENKAKANQSSTHTFQRTLQTTLNAYDVRRAIIKDLIETMVMADIPLEKVNHLRPFLQKYCREGGAIPQASTLRQVYLPDIFDDHILKLKDLFKEKSISIIMDETTDDCGRKVVNTLFTYRANVKLVSVDFLVEVNNTTIGQVLVNILAFYNISFGTPRLFLSDSASYMKKCYQNVLKPLMPQLIHNPCLAHIINLISETWFNFFHFSVIKKFLFDIKAIFVTSPARRSRYVTFLKNHGILRPQKILLPVITRWNTWFEMIYYVLDHFFLIHDFFKEESKNNPSDSIEKILSTLNNPNDLGLIHIYLHFI